MRREPLSVRGLILILGAGLLLSSGGCVTSERRASHSWNRIGEGMTKQDLAGLIGEGDLTVRPDGSEVWHYSFGTAPDPAQIGVVAGEVALLLSVIGIFYLMIGAGGGRGFPVEPDFGKGLPRLDSPQVSSGRVHFQVVFDRTGRVIEISGVEPCED